MPNVSVNRKAMKLVKDLCSKVDHYGVKVTKSDLGANIIDAGIRVEGSIEAGKAITKICLGGLGKATISSMQLEKRIFPQSRFQRIIQQSQPLVHNWRDGKLSQAVFKRWVLVLPAL